MLPKHTGYDVNNLEPLTLAEHEVQTLPSCPNTAAVMHDQALS